MTIPDEVDVSLLATVAGISLIVYVVMALIRTPLDPVIYSKWSGIIGALIGVALGVVYILVSPPVTADRLISGAIIGLLGAFLSQNVNSVVSPVVSSSNGNGKSVKGTYDQ